ncbi:MAG TPA: hypothetical protein VGP73_21080 [Thermoanaerobaculia bacterium]
MRISKNLFAAAALAALCGLAAGPGRARTIGGPPQALGSEAPMDPSPGFYYCPSVAGRANGSFAVAWVRLMDGLKSSRVLVRAGDRHGALFDAVELESIDAFAALDGIAGTAGGFEAIWYQEEAGRAPHILQELDVLGEPDASAVGLGRGGKAMSPRPAGGAVAFWTVGTELEVQLIGGDGETLTAPVSIPAGSVTDAFAVHRPSGEFVMLWSSETPLSRPFADYGYTAQRFDAAGRPQGKAFAVVPPAGTAGSSFAVAGLGADGTLAVASEVEGDDGDSNTQLRIFNAAGRLKAGPIEILVPEGKSFPYTIAVDDRGRVLLVWAPRGDPTRVRARLFSSRGEPQGDSFEIASPASSVTYPAIPCVVSAWADGQWVLAWNAAALPITQGPWQIFVRRFSG